MKLKKFTFLLVFAFIGYTVTAQKYTNTESATVTKVWKGTTFSSSKSLIDNIVEAPDLSLLNKALENKSIVKSMEAEDMITVFAISNKGFSMLQEKHDSIFDSSKAKLLTSIITYHIIPGRVDSYSIKNEIKRHGGIAYYATLQGNKIGVKEENGQLVLVDTQGNSSIISESDFYHKNGFFHIVDGIVLPEL